MAEVLGIYSLKLKTAKNQLDFKLSLNNDCSIIAFCTISNLIDIINHMLLQVDTEAFAELVRAMLSIVNFQ
jgi:hypothetical protein